MNYYLYRIIITISMYKIDKYKVIKRLEYKVNINIFIKQ